MRVVITGEKGYISQNVHSFFREKNIDSRLISVREGIEKVDLSDIDVIIHCAALVHKKYDEEEYYKVNYELTEKLAKKAKDNGAKQFIFLSTISVFGINSGVITKDTIENPKNAYGKSKLMAENKIKELEDENFKVLIVRPPMVYGKECTGNYQKLKKFAIKSMFFPDSKNKRSMIYIENLNCFLYNAVINQYNGISYPQNKEYVNTFDMVAKIKKGKIYKLPFGKILSGIKIGIFEKVFGTLIIDKELEKNNFDYCVCDFEESIIKTEE